MAITPFTNLPTINDKSSFSQRWEDLVNIQLPRFVSETNTDISLLTLISVTDTSSTSHTVSTGAKTFTVSSGKSFFAGMYLTIASTAAPTTNGLFCQVTSYSGTSLVVNVIAIQGSGTIASWSISLSAYGGAGRGANSDITSLNALTGDYQTSGATAKIGYKAGAGATYTQSTSKTTGVTVTTRTGVITMNGASLGANAKATFTVTLSGMTNNEHALVNLRGGFANQESYVLTSRATNGAFQVILWNTTAGALSEAVEVLYTIVSGAAI
jgi:hypothetical protein